jgi:hypothetical protein
MAITQATTRQLGSAAVNKDDIDVSTTTKALITKVIAGTNITISSTGVDAGTGDVTINASGGGGGGITYTEVTTTSQALAVNSGYIMNNASLVTGTLPSTSAVGDIILIRGKGAGGWKIAQNASQIIHFLDVDSLTGTGGYLSSNNRRDSIDLICTVANLEWTVNNTVGNITINIS